MIVSMLANGDINLASTHELAAIARFSDDNRYVANVVRKYTKANYRILLKSPSYSFTSNSNGNFKRSSKTKEISAVYIGQSCFQY